MKKFLSEMGFDSLSDFFQSSLGIKGHGLVIIQLCGVMLASSLAWIKDWIYEPPEAPVLLAIMIGLDTILGIAKAYTKGETLDVRRLSRQAMVTVAHVAVLALCSWLKKVEPTLFFLPNSAFIWFALRSLFSILRNLVQLRLISNDFLTHLTTKIASNFDDPTARSASEDALEGPAAPAIGLPDHSALN